MYGSIRRSRVRTDVIRSTSTSSESKAWAETLDPHIRSLILFTPRILFGLGCGDASRGLASVSTEEARTRVGSWSEMRK